MESIGTILDIVKCVGAPVCKYVQYHRKLDENMENLRNILQELNSKKEDIEDSLKKECGFGKKTKSEVSYWLQSIQKIMNETEDIEKEVNKGRYLSRARLGKLVVEKIEKVKECLQKGGSFTRLVIDLPPPRGLILPTKTLAGERNKETVEEIWAHLMSDKVTKIGVYGMGGVGKTTIMTHINNKLQKETKKFNRVIWVTVSATLDLQKLQNDIAISLDNENLFQNEEDKIKRAGKLLQILEAKKGFVLILDDVWETIPLEEVGILEPSEDNGCKLVITTRSHDVCRSMGCAPVKVHPLSNEEALNLFSDKVGRHILEVPTLKEIVESVVGQCAGLPLAIVTVAGCMRDLDNIHEWRYALNELSGHVSSVTDMDAKVFGRLEFSYSRLKDKIVQDCFLYCALYPEDFKIPKDELIGYWIAEGFFDEMNNLRAKYDRGYTILNRLVNCCLLESANNGCSVRMHDLIRDMALRITSKSPLFMVRAGMKLKELPSEQEWKENLVKASLMRSGISEIPLNMSPNCQTLSALLLQRNYKLQRIPERFFVNMHGLKILNLSHTGIEYLPNSVADLINLRSLLLGYCRRLRGVPSLAKLSALQNLDLEATKIYGVPQGLEMLQNLVYLNLYSREIIMLEAGILPKLHRLSKLRVCCESEILLETVELSNQLDTFEGYFRKLDDFNRYAKTLGSGGPKSYCLVLREKIPQVYSKLRSVKFSGGRLKFDSYFEIPHISLEKMDKMVIIVDCPMYEGKDSIALPKDVRYLHMSYVDDLRSLNVILPRDQEGNNCKYSFLKLIYISVCPDLNNLFSPELLSALQNLEVIEVVNCRKIKEIIAFNVDEEEEKKKNELGRKIITFTLPRLKILRLSILRALKSICSDGGVMVCNSLQEIDIYDCPKLKRLSLSLPLLDNGEPSPITELKEIRMSREVWESLEWDQANAKNVLDPYYRFMDSGNHRLLSSYGWLPATVMGGTGLEFV